MLGKVALALGAFVLAVLPACENEKIIQQVAAKRHGPNPFVSSVSMAASPESGGTATPVPTGKQPKVVFDRTEFDFGEIEAGEEVEHVYTFKNTGEANLVVEKVHSS